MEYVEHPIEWDDTKVSRLWDYYSRTPPYSEMYFSKVLGDRILRRSGLPLDVPLEVLDFGCGPGFLWDHMVALGARWLYTGLDFSAESVAAVRKKGEGDARFRGATHVSRLPSNLPAAHFDAVLLIEVVEHLKDEYLDGALAEAARVLKRGGVAVITTPNDEDLAKSIKICPECGAVFHEWQHVRVWSAQTLTARATRHGFTPRRVQALDFGAVGPTRRLARFARRMLRKNPGTPHLLGVYTRT